MCMTNIYHTVFGKLFQNAFYCSVTNIITIDKQRYSLFIWHKFLLHYINVKYVSLAYSSHLPHASSNYFSLLLGLTNNVTLIENNLHLFSNPCPEHAYDTNPQIGSLTRREAKYMKS